MIYMLHSIGNTHVEWIYKLLSIKLTHFEKLLIYIVKNNINTYFLKDLYEKDFIVPNKSICLTFDDGYVDNWVYLFPLLEKYNIKATIFINPEFVDNREIIRQNLNKEIKEDEKDKALGFLSWNEMIEMEKSGLVDIQSHSMSHTWYYSSDNLIDFYVNRKSHNQYPWISWNERLDRKPFTHNTFSFKSENFGLPVFEYGRSLGIRKFIPDKAILERIVKFASENKDILISNDGHKVLRNKFNEFTADRKYIGRFETDTELNERYWYELNESKKILEEKLNKNITILCWPGGVYNEISLKLSEECGYVASTVWSKDKTPVYNKNKKYKRIPRKPMTGNTAARGNNFGPSYLKNILIHENYPIPVISKTLINSEKIIRLVLNK